MSEDNYNGSEDYSSRGVRRFVRKYNCEESIPLLNRLTKSSLRNANRIYRQNKPFRKSLRKIKLGIEDKV